MSKKDTEIEKLFVKLAGDKLDKVQERVVELQAQGKTLNRARADALFDFKLNTKTED
jgi:hypothetical protein